MEAFWLAGAELAVRATAARGAGRRRRGRGRQARPAVGRAARRPRRGRVRRRRRHRRRPPRRRPRGAGRGAGAAARPQRPLPDRLDRRGEGAGHRRAARAELEEFARTEGHPDFATWVGSENYEMRVADGPVLDRPADPRHRARGGAERMSVLAIDAGTTGVTAVVVTPEAARSRPRATRSSPSTSRSRAGSSTRRRRSGRPPSRPPATRCARSTRAELSGGRHHQPARDDPALGPRDARLPAAGDRLAGPAYRRHLRAAARRGPRGPGRRADRAAPRPVLLRHQADVAAPSTSRTPGRWSSRVATRSAPSTPT